LPWCAEAEHDASMSEPKDEPGKPATFDENVASIGNDDQRERAEIEQMQRALDSRREAKWKKKGATK
jgi:hypothetical protein